MTENSSTKLKRKECTDLQITYENELKHPRNPLIGYLNINSLKNKIVDVLGKLPLDYFVLSETKFDDSFPFARFYIENFERINRGGRDKNGGGLIELVRKGFITKKIRNMKHKLVKPLLLSLPYQRKSGFALVSIGHALQPTSIYFLKNRQTL